MTQHIIMSGVQTGLPLYGEPLLRGWQAQLETLPAGFADALVARYLRFYPVSVMAEMAVARGDLAFTYELLLEAAKHILYVLCALNDIVPPGKIKGVGQKPAPDESIAPEQHSRPPGRALDDAAR